MQAYYNKVMGPKCLFALFCSACKAKSHLRKFTFHGRVCVWNQKSLNAANFYRAMNYLWDPKERSSVARIIGYSIGKKEILGVPKKVPSNIVIVNRLQYPPIVGGMGPVMEGHGEG
jgi:hypothetical protein